MKNSLFRRLLKFRIPKTVKRILNFIGGLILTTCLFFGAYISFENGWKDLEKVEKFEGIIIEKGIIDYQTSISGRTNMTSQAFFLNLKGLNQTLGVYNPEKNYNYLDNNLFIGDKIKVFYNHSNLKEKLNLETFQIEKGNQKILDCQTFQNGQRIAFYMTLIGGFVMLSLTFYEYKKSRINKSKD